MFPYTVVTLDSTAVIEQGGNDEASIFHSSYQIQIHCYFMLKDSILPSQTRSQRSNRCCKCKGEEKQTSFLGFPLIQPISIVIFFLLAHQDKTFMGISFVIELQIIGLGKSGIAATRLALARGASVLAIDQNQNVGSLLEVLLWCCYL